MTTELEDRPDGPFSTVFNLKVNGPLEDSIPLAVLGCVKFLNSDGNVDYWVFNSDDISVVEAVGMASFIGVQCRDEMTTHIYMSTSIDEDDDDDDDDDR